MVWIGGLSYSLYLWHWPVLAFFRYTTGKYFLESQGFYFIIPIIFAASYLSWKLIETPFLRRQFPAKRFFCAVFLSVLFTSLLFSKQINISIVESIPPEETRDSSKPSPCYGKIVGDCILGQENSVSEPILAIGDSHTAHLTAFFEQISKKTGQRFRAISSGNCIAIPGFEVEEGFPEYAAAKCMAAIKHGANFLETASIVVVAGMWQHHMKNKKFPDVFRSFLKKYSNAERKIIVLWQVPMLSFNVSRSRRMVKLGIYTNDAIPLHPEWYTANMMVKDLVSEYPSAQFLEFQNSDIFSYPPIHQGHFLYSDESHLNEIGSMLYGDAAYDFFSKITNH